MGWRSTWLGLHLVKLTVKPLRRASVHKYNSSLLQMCNEIGQIVTNLDFIALNTHSGLLLSIVYCHSIHIYNTQSRFSLRLKLGNIQDWGARLYAGLSLLKV